MKSKERREKIKVGYSPVRAAGYIFSFQRRKFSTRASYCTFLITVVNKKNKKRDWSTLLKLVARFTLK